MTTGVDPSDEGRTEPPSPNPMFVHDEALTSRILDYCRWRLALDPVPLDFGGTQASSSLRAAIEGLITAEGTDPERILAVFEDRLATAVVSCDSPRFLSFIPAAPTKASLLFDMVVACSSLQGTSWMEAAGAVAAENQALRVLADLVGLPPRAGGCFVSGGSAGNLSALMVARDTAGHRMGSGASERPVVAVSEEAHSSVTKALRVLGVEPLLVPDRDHRLTGDGLRSALARDPRGPDAVAVVATAGTTNAGIVDDLAGVAAVARERSLWFHVDGAYGCAALFAPSVRHRFDGIEQADSVVVDPHKWLFAPFDCAALLYREPNLAKAVHTQDASYLEVIHRDAPEEWNPSDYAYHLTRRARVCPFGSHWPSTGPPPTPTRSKRCCPSPGGPPSSSRRRPSWSWSARPSSPSCCSAAGDGIGRTTSGGRPGSSPTRSPSSPPPAGRANRSVGWPCSTPGRRRT